MASGMCEQGEGTAGAPSRDLFERNMAMLAETEPALHESLAALARAPGDIVAIGPDIDLLIDGQRLCGDGPGARERARHRIAHYLAAPTQLGWTPVRDTQSPVINFVRDRVDAIVARRGLVADKAPGHHRAAVLITFGVGLGEEVRLLTEARAFRHVILAEPDIRVLWHGLWLQDWAGLRDALTQRGGELHMLASGDPGPLATEVNLRLTEAGVIADGAYYLVNFPTPAIHACFEAFRTRVNSLTTMGFFEDEALMFRNATRNLLQLPAHFVRNDRPLIKDCPAIIVGAGPSLERALPHLAALRERAVLFSAGSTLGTLLRHGIVPDFQCEIENAQENYHVLQRATAGHDVSSVRLLGAANVDPMTAALFDKWMFYLRDPGIAADVYGDDAHAVFGSGPNCATLAIRMAARFGFREVYLFGADFGGRRPHQHHVSDSIWMTDPEWRQRYEDELGHMTIERPGNFGGRAYTNQLLEYFLHVAQTLIAASSDIAFFNCSDGVRIDGAVPKAPAAVRLGTGPADRRLAVDQIVAATSYRPAGGMIDRPRVSRFQQMYRDWAEKITAGLAGLDLAGTDLIAIHDMVAASLDCGEETGEARGIGTMSRGSLTMMLNHALHYAIRHDLLEDRDLLSAVAIGLRKAVAAMVAAVDVMIDDTLGRGAGHG